MQSYLDPDNTTTEIAFLIQARMGSSRLPNKVLLPFFEEKSILKVITDKIKQNFSEVPLLLCTSNKNSDDPIAVFCEKEGITCFRGDEKNVLKRFVDAAELYHIKTIIRVCADNPFLDIPLLQNLVAYWRQNPIGDYWSYKNRNSIPVIKTHLGLFAEIVSKNALEKVLNTTQETVYLEHVTNYIYESGAFALHLKSLPAFINKRDDIRFTIDDITDFTNLQKVYPYYIQKNQDISTTIAFINDNHSIMKNMMENINKYSK